jgi:hypothetical protein
MRKAPREGQNVIVGGCRYAVCMETAKKLLTLQREYATGEANCWDEASAGFPLRTADEVATDYADTLREFLAAPA